MVSLNVPSSRLLGQRHSLHFLQRCNERSAHTLSSLDTKRLKPHTNTDTGVQLFIMLASTVVDMLLNWKNRHRKH